MLDASGRIVALSQSARDLVGGAKPEHAIGRQFLEVLSGAGRGEAGNAEADWAALKAASGEWCAPPAGSPACELKLERAYGGAGSYIVLLRF